MSIIKKMSRMLILFLIISLVMQIVPMTYAEDKVTGTIIENFDSSQEEVDQNTDIYLFPSLKNNKGTWSISQGAFNAKVNLSSVGSNRPFVPKNGKYTLEADVKINTAGKSSLNIDDAIYFGLRISDQKFDIRHPESKGLFIGFRSNEVIIYDANTLKKAKLSNVNVDLKSYKTISVEDLGKTIIVYQGKEKSQLFRLEFVGNNIIAYSGNNEIGKIEGHNVSEMGICKVISYYLNSSINNFKITYEKISSAVKLKADEKIDIENIYDFGENSSIIPVSTDGYALLPTTNTTIMFKNVDFGDGMEYVEAFVGGGRSSTNLDFYIDNADGEPIGTLVALGRKDNHYQESDFAKIQKTSGVHDLYITFYSDTMWSFSNLAWLKFYSQKPSNYKELPPSGNIPAKEARDTFSDTWVAVDNLGRQTATFNSGAVAPKEREVNIFYFLWQSGYVEKQPQIWDIPKIVNSGEDPLPWGRPGYPHFWSEPYFGYYTGDDEWVIRKHAQMLSDAGVDNVTYDLTNAQSFDRTIFTIFKVFEEMRQEGNKTPKVSFMLGIRSGKELEFVINAYNSVYKNGYYKDHWQYWDGKPLILATPMETLPDEIKEFFTFRKSWAWTTGQAWFGNGKDAWNWVDNPNKVYGWHEDPKIPEQKSVSAAGHAATSIGRSYEHGADKTKVKSEPEKGIYYNAQWKVALDVDPKIIFLTGWNEWFAGRFIATEEDTERIIYGKKLDVGDSLFVDSYDPEYSRDTEPMKGGFGDNYYYQMTDGIRRYKGARPQFKASEKTTIDISGDFSQWQTVMPEYRDDLFDTKHRDFRSFAQVYQYKEDSGRNDIESAKLARDDNNLYFYAKTREKLTSPTDNWMTLFINSDLDYKTGWGGYDFVVNRKNGKLEKHISGFKWQEVGDISYKYENNEIMITIPKASLGIDNAKELTLDFKWADNSVPDGDLMQFMDKGDAAPNSRFNYRFTEDKINTVPQPIEGTKGYEAKKVMENSMTLIVNKPGTINQGNFAFVDKENLNVKPIIQNGRTLLPVRFISESFGSKVEWNDSTKEVKIKKDNKEIKMTLGNNIINVNGKEEKLDVPAMSIEGRTMIPIRALANALDKNVHWDERGMIIISDNVDQLNDKEIADFIYDTALVYSGVKYEKVDLSDVAYEEKAAEKASKESGLDKSILVGKSIKAYDSGNYKDGNNIWKEGYEPEKMLDGKLGGSNRWVSAKDAVGPQYVEIDLQGEKEIKNIGLVVSQGWPTKAFKFQAMVNGNWVDIEGANAADNWNGTTENTASFDLEDTINATGIRLVYTGDSHIRVEEIIVK